MSIEALQHQILLDGTQLEQYLVWLNLHSYPCGGLEVRSHHQP